MIDYNMQWTFRNVLAHIGETELKARNTELSETIRGHCVTKYYARNMSIGNQVRSAPRLFCWRVHAATWIDSNSVFSRFNIISSIKNNTYIALINYDFKRWGGVTGRKAIEVSHLWGGIPSKVVNPSGVNPFLHPKVVNPSGVNPFKGIYPPRSQTPQG